MSVLEYNKDQNVSIISHKKYLELVYKEGMFWEKLNIFDIKTPFRMDLEAENVAKRMETGDSLVNHQKKKRKLELEESFQVEITYLKEKLPIFLSLKQFHFLEGPTIEDIRHNNKTLRVNVKSLLQTLHNINIPEAGQNTSDHCVSTVGLFFHLNQNSENWMWQTWMNWAARMT